MVGGGGEGGESEERSKEKRDCLIDIDGKWTSLRWDVFDREFQRFQEWKWTRAAFESFEHDSLTRRLRSLARGRVNSIELYWFNEKFETIVK